MSRPLRIEFAGGLYHVPSRGARVGWVEAIAETHHNFRRRIMGYALFYPSYSGNGGKRMEECGSPIVAEPDGLPALWSAARLNGRGAVTGQPQACVIHRSG